MSRFLILGYLIGPSWSVGYYTPVCSRHHRHYSDSQIYGTSIIQELCKASCILVSRLPFPLRCRCPPPTLHQSAVAIQQHRVSLSSSNSISSSLLLFHSAATIDISILDTMNSRHWTNSSSNAAPPHLFNDDRNNGPDATTTTVVAHSLLNRKQKRHQLLNYCSAVVECLNRTALVIRQ